jgi:hypothetical protein
MPALKISRMELAISEITDHQSYPKWQTTKRQLDPEIPSRNATNRAVLLHQQPESRLKRNSLNLSFDQSIHPELNVSIQEQQSHPLPGCPIRTFQFQSKSSKMFNMVII